MSDGSGGFYTSSVEFNVEGSEVRYWLSRFTPSGVPAAGWTMNGLPLQSTTAYRGELSCAPDLLGGVFAAWDDNAQGGDIYAVRILPNGSVAPGWLPDGTRISDPANFDEYTSSVGPDGAGGAYFAWEKIIDGLYDRSYAQHFTAQGTLFPGWPVGGVALSTNNYPQIIPRVASDGVGNALVYWLEKATMAQLFEMDGIVATNLALASSDVRSDRVALVWQGVGAADLAAFVERRIDGGEWQRIGTAEHDGPDRLRFEDTHVTAAMRYAYRLGYLESGSEQFTTETWIDVPSAAVFALDGLRPNPAVDAINVSFSLPTASPASVELLDLAGRRVLDREVGPLGAGRHQLRLDSGEHLAPGVYWLRLRQGAQQALIRAVVMR